MCNVCEEESRPSSSVAHYAENKLLEDTLSEELVTRVLFNNMLREPVIKKSKYDER